MERTSEDLININEAKQFLHSSGLDYLGNLVFKKKTVNIGDRMYITWKQFEACSKKESRVLY
jgi:hypothetical protein